MGSRSGARRSRRERKAAVGHGGELPKPAGTGGQQAEEEEQRPNALALRISHTVLCRPRGQEPLGSQSPQRRRRARDPSKRAEGSAPRGARPRSHGRDYGRSYFAGDSNRRPQGGGSRDDRAFSRVSEFAQPSRADGAESWTSGKKFVPSDSVRRNRRFGAAADADTDKWQNSMGGDRNRDRPRLLLNPPSGTGRDASPAPSSAEEPRSGVNPFGSARPREAVLAERGQDWRKMEAEIESRGSVRARGEHFCRPTSANSGHSIRPASPPAPSSEMQAAPRPRHRINPFGDARPREVLLEEKGRVWRKMDFEFEHLAVDRLETEEERKLKEEINFLKKLAKETISNDELKVNKSAPGESFIEEKQTLREHITLEEKQLERLIRELDDKVRFGRSGGDRPGLVGRSFEYIERVSLRSGRSDGGLSHDSFARPRSRGHEIRGADIWMGFSEDRRGIRGNRERSFTNTDRLRQGDVAW